MTPTESTAELLHRLLYRALIEIRDQGRENGNKVVFHLADRFHTTALELGRAAEGKVSYDVVLRSLKEKAIETGIERWFLTAVSEVESAPSVTPVDQR